MKAANGECGGVPCLITGLLFPDLRLVGTNLAKLESLESVGVDSLDDVDCYRVKGVKKLQESPDSEASILEEVSLWIDTKTYLIRKIHSKTGVASIGIERTLHLKPEVNREIPDSAFSPGED